MFNGKKISTLIIILEFTLMITAIILIVSRVNKIKETEKVNINNEVSAENGISESENKIETRDVIEKELPDEKNNVEIMSEKIEKILSEMTLEEKIGQMFIVRCPEDAVVKAEEFHLGGYILFKRNFKGKNESEVKENIESYQSVSKIPMFIGVDEEGGTVNRISINRNLRESKFLSPRKLYSKGGFELIQSDTKEKCELLKGLGINLNFAPVCDVSQSGNDFIYARSFGKDAVATSEYVKKVVEIMSKEKTGSVLKHFPGYGNNADTHKSIVHDKRPYEIFENSDFLPFKAGIEAGADMVMVSHNVVECLDSERPASLSPKIHNVLRNELGFNGVVITDDLSMNGIRNFASDEKSAVMAVQAGNDLLCCSDFENQINAVIHSVQEGKISEERIDESVMKILKLKMRLGLR